MDCPHCGETLIQCQYGDGCTAWAEYDCWFRRSPSLVRLMVCKDHARLSEGYKANGEKAFEEAVA